MDELKRRLVVCMALLFEKDFHLISEDLHERTIAHRLASYLQQVFPSFHVDCEYNGNVFHDRRRKKIDLILERRVVHVVADEHSVFPDIIIHERKNIEHNKLVIEIKKSSNQNFEFDLEKLIFFTHPERNADYQFDFGCFIKIFTGNENVKRYTMTWYQGGEVRFPEETINL